MASRSDSISGYLPGFEVSGGIKVYSANLKSNVVSGTAISANVTYAVAHGLGAVPRAIFLTPSLTKTQAAASAVATVVAVADQTSATTSTNFYVVANKAGVKFKAFAIL